LAAAIEVALIRLAGDGDVGVFVILVVGWGRVSWGRVSWGRVGRGRVSWGSVLGSRVRWCFVFRLVAGRSSGSDGQKGGDNKLWKLTYHLISLLKPGQM
jgi:hypothetical protein